jgi:hypothetical protein
LITSIASKLHREFYHALLPLGNAMQQSGGFHPKFLKPFCRAT